MKEGYKKKLRVSLGPLWQLVWVKFNVPLSKGEGRVRGRGGAVKGEYVLGS